MKRFEKKIPISRETDIMIAAFEAKKASRDAGFSENNQFMITTAVSELARNIFIYARQGAILIELLVMKSQKGIQVIAEDNGPGIHDIAKALEDHFTTGNSLGLGLPGVKRIMDEFIIDSTPGKGTTVTARKWNRNA
jgi:serine/threonine-protein kinase RsbT